MISRQDLFDRLNYLVPDAKFSFWTFDPDVDKEPAENMFRIDQWIVKWFSENTQPMPTYQAIKSLDGIPLTPLPERVNNAVAKLLEKRNSQTFKNVEINGDVYFADQESQNLINQTLSSQERGIEGIFPASWILANGTVKQVIYDDLKSVNAVVAQRISVNYANYFNLIQQIMTSQVPENIDITQGWSGI